MVRIIGEVGTGVSINCNVLCTTDKRVEVRIATRLRKEVHHMLKGIGVSINCIVLCIKDKRV